jgi:anthranilate phosphoribosyltransferase
MKKILNKLLLKEDLTTEETKFGMNEIMEGNATPIQISAFLVALRMKGEAIDEIIGCASVMQQKAERVHFSNSAIDIVGTGGDCLNTFNISTCSAFVVSAAGLPVAKHGNRSTSSNCGSADVLEALGTNIALSPALAQKCLESLGICFMFAPSYHLSMKYVAPIRKELGIRTIFNILGPLANPAKPNFELLGVYDERLLIPMTKALQGLGLQGAMTVHSRDGLDELSISDKTFVCELRDHMIKSYIVEPEQFGLKTASIDSLKGGDAIQNAEIIKAILKGEKGAKRDVVLLNSGAALYTAKISNSIKEGIELAAKAIDSGEAYKKLMDYIAASKGESL